MNIPFVGDAESIELVAGAIRFTPVGAAVCIAVTSHFFYSLYSRCWRKGLVIDFWHLVIGQGVIAPFFLMYPFASAIPNVIAIGPAITDAQESFGAAFLINLVGYLALLAGTRSARVSQRAWPRADGGLYDRWAARIKRAVLDTQISIRLLEVSCLIGVFLLVYSQLSFGAVFGVRDRLFQEPATRALFNLWYSLHVVSFSLGAIRFYQRGSIYVGALLALSFMSAVVTGSRSMALLPALDVGLVYLVVFKDQLRWRVILVTAAILFATMTAVTSLRTGERVASLDEADIGLPLVGMLYGNTFSDLRDFAWVLSAWQQRGDYLYGLGYASSILSFVPRSLSEFRERYALPIYTNELVGIDSTEHPGLRGGKFMEPFLNFGLIGVLVVGFIAGRFLGRSSEIIKQQTTDAQGLASGYSAIIPYFIVSQLMNSAGFWVVYVYLAIYAVASRNQPSKKTYGHN